MHGPVECPDLDLQKDLESRCGFAIPTCKKLTGCGKQSHVSLKHRKRMAREASAPIQEDRYTDSRDDWDSLFSSSSQIYKKFQPTLECLILKTKQSWEQKWVTLGHIYVPRYLGIRGEVLYSLCCFSSGRVNTCLSSFLFKANFIIKDNPAVHQRTSRICLGFF